MVKVSYIDGTTYIYDLLYEESTKRIDDLTLAQALLLSIKLGVDLDYNMDELDDDVKRIIKEDIRECRNILSGEYELDEEDDLSELFKRLGRLYMDKFEGLLLKGLVD